MKKISLYILFLLSFLVSGCQPDAEERILSFKKEWNEFDMLRDHGQWTEERYSKDSKEWKNWESGYGEKDYARALNEIQDLIIAELEEKHNVTWESTGLEKPFWIMKEDLNGNLYFDDRNNVYKPKQ